MHRSFKSKVQGCFIFLCIFAVVLLGFHTWTNSRKSTPKELSAESVFNGTDVILDQSDPALLNFIRKHHLFPPSQQPYNLTKPIGDPAFDPRQWKIAHSYLGNKTGGFFIECGANDGEFISTTLVLERDYGWNGILIEGDPNIFPDLFGKHRKAWISNVCLSTNPFPQVTTMMKEQYGKGGGVIKYAWDDFKNWKYYKKSSTFTVKCLPFFSVMSALGIFEVDIFVLDIEWAEIPVLKTIPFDKIYIKVFVIEVHAPTEKDLVPLLMSKGYKCMGVIEGHRDYVFVHEKLYDSSTPELQPFGICKY